MRLSLPRPALFAHLGSYQVSWLRSGIPAGLAIAALGLPSAIAYPAIAGLSPETGLYASIIPLPAFALFGSSRQLIVGPDAAALLALVVGVLCLIARAVRLEVLTTFLSRPILTGFFAGISLSIPIGQVKRFAGGDDVHGELKERGMALAERHTAPCSLAPA